jgi:hypothetical protein
MNLDPVTAISNAISEVAKVIGNMLATRTVRHMKVAIDAAERYIDVNERYGDNANLSEEDRMRLLSKFRKRFKKFH